MARRSKAIFFGTDTATNQPTYVSLKWLQERNIHIIGPPGEGKTYFQFGLFQNLCRIPEAAVVVINPKGSFTRKARDWALGHGLTRRLVWFDPGDEQALIGYNPLWPNSLPIATQAKSVREAIRSAWGQANFDATPQLARMLLLALGVCRAFHLTLKDAVLVLRSGAAGAPIRRKLIASLASQQDLHFFHDALRWFDSLTERRQEELSASATARIESFVSDPAIAVMLTAQRSLDISQIIAEHKILLVNLEIKRPLAVDDVRLLGRMIVNDIVNHAFAKPSQVFLLMDECHQFLSLDLCQALDMGRELGLHVVLSHQNLDQLRQEDESRRVYASVMKSARIKVIFGDCAADDLDILLRDAMIDQYDNMKVKDELTTLELDPQETSRLVFSFSVANGHTSGTTEACSRGTSHSTFESQGNTVGVGSAIASGHSSGMFAGVSTGEMMLANGDVMMGTHETSGTTAGDFASESSMETESWSNASGVQDTVSESQLTGSSEATNRGTTMGVVSVPFYEYRKRRNVSSRTFETEQEFLTKCLQKAKAQPVGHFLLKLPKRPALFLRAPFVRDPWITERQRTANLARVYEQLCYERREPPALPPTTASQLTAPDIQFGAKSPTKPGEEAPPEDDFFLR